MAESNNVREKAVIQIGVAGIASNLLDFGKDGIGKRTALCHYILLLDNIVDKDCCHVVLVAQVNRGSECTQYKKHVDCFCIS